MMNRKGLLAVVLCVGLGLAGLIVSCGDDDDKFDARCEAACNKLYGCVDELVQEFPDLEIEGTRTECYRTCTEEIREPEVVCVLACDRGLECMPYALCLNACGIFDDDD